MSHTITQFHPQFSFLKANVQVNLIYYNYENILAQRYGSVFKTFFNTKLTFCKRLPVSWVPAQAGNLIILFKNNCWFCFVLPKHFFQQWCCFVNSNNILLCPAPWLINSRRWNLTERQIESLINFYLFSIVYFCWNPLTSISDWNSWKTCYWNVTISDHRTIIM